MDTSENPGKKDDRDTESAPELESEPTETPEHAAEIYESFFDEIDTEGNVFSEEGTAPETEQPNADQLRIQTLEEQLDRMKNQMIRALAEAENTRKRAIKERRDTSKFAVSSFARDILNVADNLRRAIESIPAEILEEFQQVKNMTEGIEATERELLRCFEKNGIVKLEPLDEKFDPNFHEVMFEAPVPGKENSTIIQIIEPGYTINGRILRPARVGIAKNTGDIPPSPPEDTDSSHNVDTEA